MLSEILDIIVALQIAVSEKAVEGIEAPTISPASDQHTVMSLVLGAGPVVQLVLLVLVAMSLVTWGIVITKYLNLKKAKNQSQSFVDVFWNSKNLDEIGRSSNQYRQSPVASVFNAGNKELRQYLGEAEIDEHDELNAIESVERALAKAKAEEVTKLEEWNSFLATTASAAPFIGLFGTVWGIMNAFIGLSQVKTSSIQAVAPGISEALIATAIGLAAAIPAAIAYNYFMQQVRVIARTMDMFSAEFLNIAQRHFLKS